MKPTGIFVFLSLFLMCAISGGPAFGVDQDLRNSVDSLLKERAALREKASAANLPPRAGAQSSALANKYGPSAKLTTKDGKLAIKGLVQVWYYALQNDNLGFFGDITRGVAQGGDTHETKDNDSLTVATTTTRKIPLRGCSCARSGRT